ncbi:hypothetical protein HCY58_15220 [Acinetobacter radioresistens]|uniref:hypothetical protein n=1 Tax=Acinetobacter radioresistens TaxID=40216 RepID=UPI002005B1F1|nr:hypothetical protein [Acinetobacter radioresistens]MCK4088388.1 hypothetical protein [Acinetobacter radioresistens]
MANIVKDVILPFLPSILTIIGWWIVASRDGNSKKNAIHNRRVESASKLIDKILMDAKKFYSLVGSDPEARVISSLIVSDFKKLSAIVNLIIKELKAAEKQSLSVAFIEYKKMVTGGEFETISRSAVGSSNQFYLDIDATHNDLYIELEKTYLI